MPKLFQEVLQKAARDRDACEHIVLYYHMETESALWYSLPEYSFIGLAPLILLFQILHLFSFGRCMPAIFMSWHRCCGSAGHVVFQGIDSWWGHWSGGLWALYSTYHEREAQQQRLSTRIRISFAQRFHWLKVYCYHFSSPSLSRKPVLVVSPLHILDLILVHWQQRQKYNTSPPSPLKKKLMSFECLNPLF